MRTVILFGVCILMILTPHIILYVSRRVQEYFSGPELMDNDRWIQRDADKWPDYPPEDWFKESV